jgi:hypothetical protein
MPCCEPGGPDGAHLCTRCNVPMYAICGEAVGEEDGHGTQRTCSRQPAQTVAFAGLPEQLNSLGAAPFSPQQGSLDTTQDWDLEAALQASGGSADPTTERPWKRRLEESAKVFG